MSILLKSVIVKDNTSHFHNQKVDVLIINGVIESISKTISYQADKIIEGNSQWLTNGFFDIGTALNEPGYEHKEDLETLVDVAKVGGYTHLATTSNTYPVIQYKEQVKALKGSYNGVDIIPIPALTKDNKGLEMTQMLDMASVGVNVFSDGVKTIFHPGILIKSLQYLQYIDGLVIQKPFDKYLSKGGQMHEGEISTIKGLKGVPSIAETVAIQRDLELLRYSEGKLHFHTISTKKGVELIKSAKKEGLNVTCDVSVFHLAYTDEELGDFDTNYKFNPPLRGDEDRKALIQGVLDGTIDVITSMHQPHEEDCKKLEFDFADFGALSLETVLPILVQVFGNDVDAVLPKVNVAPYRIMGVKTPQILEGAKANLALIDIGKEWTYKTKSSSRNSPLLGQMLKGQVQLIISNNTINEVV